jgi:hypothetical protein
MSIMMLVNTSCVTQNAQKTQDENSNEFKKDKGVAKQNNTPQPLSTKDNATTTEIYAPRSPIKNEKMTATSENSPRTPNKKELSYEPAVVELEGKLTIKTYWGPPNFGGNPKTDSKLKEWILKLNEPIDVIGDKDPTNDETSTSVYGVTKVQLVLLGPHRNLVGKRVLVKGMLFHGTTGHHFTDVLMLVQSISPSSK